MEDKHSRHIEFNPHNNRRLAALCGQHNEHLNQLEKALGVQIEPRGNIFRITGSSEDVIRAHTILNKLYQETEKSNDIDYYSILLELKDDTSLPLLLDKDSTVKDKPLTNEVVIQIKNQTIKGHTENQRHYLANIRKYDINFSIGPAGTGKTYLAVASGVDALENSRVKRLLLVRPAVEAGEKLGFLPGSLEEKISPYLRPLYDALFEMLGFEKINKLISQNIIEIAPLAYMRGRTLNDAFIILDESQNTTTEQMKMFLTRIGFNSRAVITGDITQIDLPRGKKSGLVEASEVLKNVSGVCFTHFGSRDVVRHPIVQRIIEAYDAFQALDKTDSNG